MRRDVSVDSSGDLNEASPHAWLRAALLIGAVYFLTGRLFALPSSHVHAPAMASLLAQLGYPTGARDLPSRVEAIEGEGGVVFVALGANERIVGLASGARVATLHAPGHVAYITALVTAEDARGQGVGRALVAAGERWAREHDCASLSVTSAEHRADAHAFYPRCGLPYAGRRFSRRIDAAPP